MMDASISKGKELMSEKEKTDEWMWNLVRDTTDSNLITTLYLGNGGQSDIHNNAANWLLLKPKMGLEDN